MYFPALGEFLRYLETIGEVHRVKVAVDPRLELTEIATRALKEEKPVLLFENVRGSRYPLVMNVYASERRIEYALGKHPEQIGEELISFFEQLVPPKPSTLWRHRTMVKRVLTAKGVQVSSARSQEVVEEPNLDELPVQTCWPNDGGKFLTMGQVFTYDPLSAQRNVGMYRLQVFDRQTTGMHIQIERGGGAHYHRAETLGRQLEVAVALGTDPALLLATIAALPEGIDEVLFAAFLRGRPVPMVRGKHVSIFVPANAEFVLEGFVPPNERALEGPFGDHLGHYSKAAPFPVFHLRAITRRRSPVYPATVVGVPPMEDKYLGNATQQILGPLVRLIHKEVKDLWAYYEAGFHNLLVVSVEERYRKEAMKAALGLLGTGQLSLTKCLVLVSHHVNPRNWRAVLQEIREHFDPHYDFLLLPKVPLDTLDFTSFTMELGSKMILDATQKRRERATLKHRGTAIPDLKKIDARVLDSTLMEQTLLVVKVKREGRSVVEKLVKNKQLQGIKIVAAVSEDVDLGNQENLLWGIFTRFDCERDIVFTEQRLFGIAPVYNGMLGIDATWKKGYPEPLVMDDKIVKLVDRRWKEYWS
jgi:4-hydroxy-3-polyprenylbenzoate decarboxylase